MVVQWRTDGVFVRTGGSKGVILGQILTMFVTHGQTFPAHFLTVGGGLD